MYVIEDRSFMEFGLEDRKGEMLVLGPGSGAGEERHGGHSIPQVSYRNPGGFDVIGGAGSGILRGYHSRGPGRYMGPMF